MDARVGPALVLVIEPRLRFFDRLEAKPAERLLRVRDARLDLSLAVRIADPTRQCDRAVVREHIAIERIEQRIVDVGLEHALAQFLSSTTAAVTPPSRRNACSWSCAQIFVDDFHVSSRTDLRLCASVSR